MRGALAAAAAMGVAATGVGCAPAGGSGKESTAAGDDGAASQADVDYVNIYKDGVNQMPARKVACPGPRGPVASNRGKSLQAKSSAKKISISSWSVQVWAV